ncbi:MAG: phospholipase D-like domain-containing protein, partial [Candidatus Thermoplasmatota archaeon]
PFGGISNSEKYITNELVNNGADVGFLISNVSAGIYYRYKVNHAKYALIDNETTIITTANWKLSGIPVNPSYGNREWGILIRNKNLTNYFLNVFKDDFKVGMKDVFLFNSSDLKYGSPTTGFEIDKEVPKGKYKPKFGSAKFNGKFKFTPIISPDNSFELMLELLKNANESIYLEMATISMSWNYKDDKLENVYLNALIEAARRGCKVRVLLDSRFVDVGMEIVDNKDVADYVNMIGKNERLDIEAKVVKLENLEKLHTKGIIVDGKITLISSINWVRGSAIMNREVGVIIENEELASYYSSVFLYDWEEKGIEKEEKKITEITYNYLFLLTPLVVTIIIILWALREKKK